MAAKTIAGQLVTAASSVLPAMSPAMLCQAPKPPTGLPGMLKVCTFCFVPCSAAVNSAALEALVSTVVNHPNVVQVSAAFRNFSASQS